jgi:flagellar export protein FliJ
MSSKRFAPIRDIVASRAQELSVGMSAAERRVVEMEQQLAQLETFRADYLQRAQTSGPMDTVRLQNNRAFLDRIAEAIRQQQQKLGVARAEYEARRQQWSEKRIEAEALGQAVERLRADERIVAERRDQQASDEAGLRTWLAVRSQGER